MAFDENVAARVRRILARRRGITEKKMMGALCFMADGTMCCGVTGAALMIRVEGENFEKTLARPHVRPLEIGQRTAHGFIVVDPPGCRTEASLMKWVEQGLAMAKRLRAAAAKRPAASRRRPVK
ncbi:MAG TPA: TfoX/Sxy family protein [Stellaceae bacterium]|jgi:TfoX/Sxy family transcriptional regulator of competence genes